MKCSSGQSCILDFLGAHKRVQVECAMNALNVDVDMAVPLGLIVNELLTNTIKYPSPMEEAARGFSHIKFAVTETFGQGDKLTKHWTFTGMHTGNFFGIPATGKTVTVEGSTIARMKNGIIMEEQDFFDNLHLFTQLGLYL